MILKRFDAHHQGREKNFPSKKKPAANYKDILEKITEEEPLTVEDLNVDAAFKVA